jgi:hypothetical protein
VLKSGSSASNIGDSVTDCISSIGDALKQPIVISSGNPLVITSGEHDEAARMKTVFSVVMNVASVI